MSETHHTLDELPEQIRDRVEIASDECWLWTGAGFPGHGKVSWQGKSVGVHRLVYELLVGPIPERAVVHHRCHRPACIRPEHLEAVTGAEHAQRHTRSAAYNRGEALTPFAENLRRLKDASGRTWTDIAAEIGVHVRYLHFWSSGKYEPRLSTVRKLADAFGVEPADMLGE